MLKHDPKIIAMELVCNTETEIFYSGFKDKCKALVQANLLSWILKIAVFEYLLLVLERIH